MSGLGSRRAALCLAASLAACAPSGRSGAGEEGALATLQHLDAARRSLGGYGAGPGAPAGRSLAEAGAALLAVSRPPGAMSDAARALQGAGHALGGALGEDGPERVTGETVPPEERSRAAYEVALAGGLLAPAAREEALIDADRALPPAEESLPAAAAQLAAAGRALLATGAEWTAAAQALVAAARALSPEPGSAAARDQAAGLAQRHVELALAFAACSAGRAAEYPRPTGLSVAATRLGEAAGEFARSRESFAEVAESLSAAAHWLRMVEAALAGEGAVASPERCRALAARHVALAAGLLAEADGRLADAVAAGAESLSPRQLRPSAPPREDGIR